MGPNGFEERTTRTIIIFGSLEKSLVGHWFPQFARVKTLVFKIQKKWLKSVVWESPGEGCKVEIVHRNVMVGKIREACVLQILLVKYKLLTNLHVFFMHGPQCANDMQYSSTGSLRQLLKPNSRHQFEQSHSPQIFSSHLVTSLVGH
jgi:hypothetical protein